MNITEPIIDVNWACVYWKRKSMKQIIIITAYCDTEEKKDVLKNCILQFKGKPYDILLYSHYPVEPETQKLCNYSFYDFSNPILNVNDHNKGIVHWHRSSTLKRHLRSLREDYGFAVMQQWLRSFNFVENLNYDRFHFINYDVFLSDDILNKTEELLNENDGIFYYFGNERFFELNICLFSGNFSFIKNLMNSISYEDYINSFNKYLEQYMMLKIDSFLNYKIQKIQFQDYGGIIGTDNSTEISSKISWKGPFDLMVFDGFKIFGGHNEINHFEFIVYDISKELKVELEIENKEKHIFDNISDFCIINTSLNFENLFDIIDKNQLHIKINEQEIDKEIYKIFLKGEIVPDGNI